MTHPAPDAVPLPPIKGPDDFVRAFDVSRETIDQLKIYASLLGQWQPRINLVANATLADVWHRHLADSAQIVRLAPSAKSWLDLGSGAGFPGLVVAIMMKPVGTRVALVESDKRKCAFLAEVARQTGVAVEIRPARIEQTATQGMLGQVDVVSARALAPLARLIPLSLPFFRDDTVGIFPKGRGAESEVAEALAAWTFDVEMVPSLTDEEAQVVVIRRPRARTEG
jgi:16S rRNA (guanine527-N7)-methyltransferase